MFDIHDFIKNEKLNMYNGCIIKESICDDLILDLVEIGPYRIMEN